MKERGMREIMRTPIRKRSLSDLAFQIQIAGVGARASITRARILDEADTRMSDYYAEVRVVLRELDRLRDDINNETLVTEQQYKEYRKERCKTYRKRGAQ